MKSVLRVWTFSLTAFLTSGVCTAFAEDLPLIDAVKSRDRAAIHALMAQHTDVNATGKDGATALAWAAIRDDAETVDLLLRAGANVNLATDYGVTPLSLACTNRNAAIVKKLLEAGANPSANLWTGETALMTCAQTGAVEAVKVLLARGVDLNARENQQGHTALMRAVAERHPDVVRTLIEQGADVRARSKGGFTALLFAGQQGDVDSARLLLAAGADVNESRPENGTALVVSTASGHEDFALFLLDHGADPNATDTYGFTALHYAIPRGIAGIDSVSAVFRPSESVPPDMPKLVKALLSQGADPNVKVKKDFPSYSRSPYARQTSLIGATPFLLAAAAADLELMHVLLDGGADAHLTLQDGSTALMLAAGVGRVDDRSSKEEEANALEAVKLAAKLGDDVNAANMRGRTAVHGAAGIGADAIIHFLAENGADLNAKDRQGNTPMKVASGSVRVSDGADRVYENTVNLLLKLGAQPLK